MIHQKICGAFFIFISIARRFRRNFPSFFLPNDSEQRQNTVSFHFFFGIACKICVFWYRDTVLSAGFGSKSFYGTFIRSPTGTSKTKRRREEKEILQFAPACQEIWNLGRKKKKVSSSDWGFSWGNMLMLSNTGYFNLVFPVNCLLMYSSSSSMNLNKFDQFLVASFHLFTKLKISQLRVVFNN